MTEIGTTYTIPYALTLQPDGKILVAGQTKFSTQALIFVARYNLNGTLDNSFNEDGIQTTAIGTGFSGASAIALQPNGKIVVVGTFSWNYNIDRHLRSTLQNRWQP